MSAFEAACNWNRVEQTRDVFSKFTQSYIHGFGYVCVGIRFRKASRNQIEADTGKQSLYHSESVSVDKKRSMPKVKWLDTMFCDYYKKTVLKYESA